MPDDKNSLQVDQVLRQLQDLRQRQKTGEDIDEDEEDNEMEEEGEEGVDWVWWRADEDMTGVSAADDPMNAKVEQAARQVATALQ
jgi:hypothetical protein